MINMTLFKICLCSGQRSEDKKGGVDRSSTVIAKEPEGKHIITIIIYFPLSFVKEKYIRKTHTTQNPFFSPLLFILQHTHTRILIACLCFVDDEVRKAVFFSV